MMTDKPNEPYTFMGRKPTVPAPESKPIPRKKRIGPPPPPLRKVVETGVMVDVSVKPDEYKMEVPHWKLECGHLVNPPSDIYGERYPARMRCRKCAKERDEK